MKTPMTVFFLVQTTPTWLALSPAARNDFVTRVIRPLLQKHPTVTLRYFDAEAYNAHASDVIQWQLEDQQEYRSVIEGLRETPFWGTYFEVREIIPCVEDGFATHYGFEPISSSARSTTRAAGEPAAPSPPPARAVGRARSARAPKARPSPSRGPR